MSLARSAAPVVALLLFTAARPSGPFAVDTMLNGQAQRWTLPDGGRSGLFAGSGQACVPIAGGSAVPSVLLVVPEGPVNLCVRPSSGSAVWDGGCNITDTDENFGVPLQAWLPLRIVLDPSATQICGVSDAGVVRVPLWMMR